MEFNLYVYSKCICIINYLYLVIIHNNLKEEGYDICGTLHL